MAYNDHGAYQAPPRGYYNQPRQQGPAMPHRPRDQDRYDQGRDRGYDQGYNQPHDQYQYYDQYYDQGHNQNYSQQGYGGQERGYAQQRQQAPGYAPQDQRHDPRQAPPRGAYNQRAGPPSRGGPPPYHNGVRDDGYQQQSRMPYGNPRFANSTPQTFDLHPPSPMYASHPPELPRSSSDQMGQKPRPPPLDRAGSYESAQRNARRPPLTKPVSPAGLPQDSAFPIFPNMKKKQQQQLPQDRPSTSSTTRNSDKALPPVSVRYRPDSAGQSQHDGASVAEAILAEHMSEPFTSPRPDHKPAHSKQDSQSDIYADYYSRDLGTMAETPIERDAQIEADMPNFDSNGASYGAPHRRGKTVDEHLATSPAAAQSPPPLPPMPSQTDPRAAGNFRRPSPGLGPHPANMPPRRDNYFPAQDARTGTPNLAYATPLPPPQRPETADQYGRPSFDGVRHPQGAYRPPTAPPTMQAASTYPAPQTIQQHPDALPHHPAPFRPGHMERSGTPNSMGGRGSGQSYAPASAIPRSFTPQSSHNVTPPAGNSRRSSAAVPVTQAEINQLQAQVNAHPQDSATALLLAKKLVEAASVLSSQDGRLDARQTAKNRERYILDAHRRVKKLVGQGYPEAMFYLADCYGQGLLGLEEDPKEAFGHYQAAAKAGHGQAAYRTALCCEIGPEEGGGTRRDIQKAVQWYRRAAQLQDITAMYKLGIICLRGLLSQQKNVPEAERWLKRAAEKADKDNPHALHELGLLYEPDNPDKDVKAKVIPDENYSRELFFKAANMGYKNSQFRLGQAYEYGALGLPVDARNSIAWYSKAAAQGEHGAELALSGWYLTGAEGILDNSDQEAYLWARKAASADPPLAKAMFAMGYYTETGIGCPANLDEAKKWYGRAASYKFPKAIDRLEELKRGGNKYAKDMAGKKLHRKDVKDKVR